MTDQGKNRPAETQIKGEGNPEADQRYREGVRQTVEETSEAERADKARNLKGDDKAKARQAEEAGKSHARK